MVGWIKALSLIIAALFLTNCQFLDDRNSPILAVPEQISYEDEVELVQLSYELNRTDIDDETRVRLFYRRGTLYDSLGFRAFAQSDFSQILAITAEIPDVYNYLGILASGQGDIDSALLAYNTALEMNPDNEFTRLNRAIALYNNKRFFSARDDALLFYQRAPDESYRLLWLYLIEYELDKDQAKRMLAQRYDAISQHDDWSNNIIAFYLGNMSERDLINSAKQGTETNRELAQRLCEVYFYLGKFYLNKGNEKRAELMFKYTLSNNIFNYIEHQQALFELALLEQEQTNSSD